MATTARIEAAEDSLLGTLRGFLKSILALESISALLVQRQLPVQKGMMPTLITDPERVDTSDPLAPFFPMNAAKLVSRLTRKPSGGTVAVVLRSCEIRALIELVKLNQASLDDILIIGIDCLGAFSNQSYRRFMQDWEDSDQASLAYIRDALSPRNERPVGFDIQSACRTCVNPLATGADLSIGLLGADIDSHLPVFGQTDKGASILTELNLAEMSEPAERTAAVSAFLKQRQASRDAMLKETAAAVDGIEKLTAYLSACINCYNCRVACPVCYCRECVFVTDVFEHEPSQYLRWAQRKGAVKVPTDTVFFHMTRLAHMSTACVGCGQCSNACPNDIPVMELFQTVAERTQKAFDYQAGRSVDDVPPLSEFRENEYEEVVGI